MPKPVYVNNEVARMLGPSLGKQGFFQSYSGSDIQALLYLPLISSGTAAGSKQPRYKIFAELQTISISSTRSISPVRVLGSSSPIAWTRGARSFAGTMVFASLNEDVFKDVYDESIAESTMAASTSLMSDQLPPFSVVITAANEKGAVAVHVIHGITLVNYGTTYSIDDLYTEVVYSYVATDVLPLSATPPSQARDLKDQNTIPRNGFLSVEQKLMNSLGRAYGSSASNSDAIARYLQRDPGNPFA